MSVRTLFCQDKLSTIELRSCGEADGELLHAALRAEPDTAPVEIAFSHQNNLAHLLRL